MINYYTKNTSFIDVCRKLEETGSVGGSELLTLNNEALLHVDPHDLSLDQKTQDMVLEEIRENIWYFFREVVRITTPTGLEMFKLSRMSALTIKLLSDDYNVILVAPRQSGKKTIFYLVSIYQSILKGNRMEFIGSDVDEYNSRQLYSSLPQYLCGSNTPDVIKYGSEHFDVPVIMTNFLLKKYDNIRQYLEKSSMVMLTTTGCIIDDSNSESYNMLSDTYGISVTSFDLHQPVLENLKIDNTVRIYADIFDCNMGDSLEGLINSLSPSGIITDSCCHEIFCEFKRHGQNIKLAH